MSQLSPSTSEPSILSPVKFTQQPKSWLSALWKFSRPHTVIGTSLSVFSLFLLTIAGQYNLSLEPGFGIAPSAFYGLLVTWMACLCGNVYIVGLNQLEDVEIDRINKPSLPLASGAFSRQQAFSIVSMTGILALLLAGSQSGYLLAMVGISLLIGTAYSLPPVRLKRFPFWASFCIFTVRGVVVNLGLFLHFNDGLPIPPKVWALTLFILVFTFAIAIFKDMPDAEGDRQYNISTLTIKLGQQTVFNLSRWTLTVCYGGMAIAGIAGLPGVNSLLLVGLHLGLLGIFWWRSFDVDLTDKTSISSFYQFIWKLFFLEYLLFPLVCF